VGRDRFADTADRYGLKVRARVRKPRTTGSTHGLPFCPNLTKDFFPYAVNQLWVSDITYITDWRDEYTYVFCCLSLIMDSYSKEIVGWSVGSTLGILYQLEALKKALKHVEEQEDIHLIPHLSVCKRGVCIAVEASRNTNQHD
jgi:transposase InsO family protein